MSQIMASLQKNMAMEHLKGAFYSQKVSPYNALQVQQKLEDVSFENFEEKLEVSKHTGVPIKDLKIFLDHLEEAYDGIDKELRVKMEGALFGQSWTNYISGFRYPDPDPDPEMKYGCKYGCVAFGKSIDGNSFDFAYCLFKMDFQISRSTTVWTKKEKSFLFGLFQWEELEKIEQKTKFNVKDKRIMDNYFKFEALNEFYEEGIIDHNKFNKVASLKDVNG